METRIDQLNRAAVEVHAQGRYAEGARLAEEALELARAHLDGRHPLLAASLANLGEMRRANGEYATAEPLLAQALEAKRAILPDTHPSIATTLNNLAELYRETGRFAEAETCHRSALEIRRRSRGPEHWQTVQSMGNLALLHLASGDWARGESLCREALAICRRSPAALGRFLAQCLTILAAVCRDTGEVARSLGAAAEAYRVASDSLGEDHPDSISCLDNLAALYTLVRNYDAAEQTHRLALESRRRQLGDRHPDCALTWNNLGELCRRSGRYAEAEQHFSLALDLIRSAAGEESPVFATTLENLASLHGMKGDYRAAEGPLRRVLELRSRLLGRQHPAVGRTLANLAAICAATDRAGEALELADRALAIEERALGQVFSFASEAWKMAALHATEGTLHTHLSLVSRHLAEDPAAIRSAFGLVLRRKAVAAEVLARQREAVLVGRYPELEPRLRELGLLRAQIARSTLAGPGADGLEPHRRQLAEWNRRKEDMEAELARRIPELDRDGKLRAADRAAVAGALPAGAALVEFARFRVLDFQAVPAQGEEQWKPARYVAFVLTAGDPDRVRMVDLGEATEIERLIAAFRAAVTGEEEARGSRARDAAPAPEGHPNAARDTRGAGPDGIGLRALVFDPLLPSLAGHDRLFLAPDADLTRLPFEVLPLDGGDLLMDRYRVSYVATGRELVRFAAAPHRDAAPPLVVAHPDFDLACAASPRSDGPDSGPLARAPHGRRSRDLDLRSFRFEPLPASRLEGEAIGHVLGVEPWLAESALEARLRCFRSPRILHLATHGFFLPDQERDPAPALRAAEPFAARGVGEASGGARFPGPDLENPLLRSGLALAGVNTWARGGALPEEAEDGLLTAEDVTGLDLLDTELVVLSACETGLGEVHVGEGVFGLRRAFVVAGAKGLVMSLWKVPDGPTQELMEEFYGRLLAGEGRADALRGAQLALRERYPHPYYWGAFIYQGDPGPIATGAGPA